MKKLILGALVICLLCSLTACGKRTEGSSLKDGSSEKTVAVSQGTGTAKNDGGVNNAPEKTPETEKAKTGERKLKLIVAGKELAVTLYDTPAANALYDMLPLELSFEDFNGIEKISYLPQKLPTKGEPDGCDPDVGDFCRYAPWGNLSVFYRDFRYSKDLIMLGHIDSGLDLIAGQTGNFSATLQKWE